MRTAASVITGIVGLLLVVNGVWMVVTPLGWFTTTPIVWRTGVPNGHFIRDVGWTYGAVGALLLWGLVRVSFRAQARMLAIVWLAGHAAVHIGEAAIGLCSASQFVLETPQVLGPIVLLLLAAALDAVLKRKAAS